MTAPVSSVKTTLATKPLFFNSLPRGSASILVTYISQKKEGLQLTLEVGVQNNNVL